MTASWKPTGRTRICTVSSREHLLQPERLEHSNADVFTRFTSDKAGAMTIPATFGTGRS
jgi:hypothetical protein